MISFHSSSSLCTQQRCWCTWHIVGKRNVLHELEYSVDGCYPNDEEGCIQDYAIPEKLMQCLPLRVVVFEVLRISNTCHLRWLLTMVGLGSHHTPEIYQRCIDCTQRRVGTKPGLWTGLDYGLDFGLRWRVKVF